MTRKKVKLAFISNDSARKATLKKRKKGLMKKVSELSTLCGIDACAIIYSPYENQPEVWPNTAGAQRVVAQFKRMPEMEQSKKMVNQESFIRQRIAKAGEQLKKLRRENREKEITEVMYQLLTGKAAALQQSLILTDLNDLAWMLDQNLKEIDKRIETLKKEAAAAPVVSQPAAAVIQTVTAAADQQEEVGVDLGQRQNWFVDWMMSNPNEHMGFEHGGGSGGGGGGDEMNIPNHHAVWPGAFFP
ncbi:unnamed protein product [Cuscuta campestris]|uniref:MADS-box domain-containing protein n=1 Tax=Cuscuta campestris TaxID=132261 RepID=A0A484KCG2_9ASTE|nr:unnamed protein product [Cuscuta campestris]